VLSTGSYSFITPLKATQADNVTETLSRRISCSTQFHSFRRGTRNPRAPTTKIRLTKASTLRDRALVVSV
jgi:hypothetical protein